MSVFDGLTGVLAAVFGAPVTITPVSGSAVVVRAILRETLVTDEDEGARDHALPVYTLQVRKPIPAALVRGSTATSAERPGETFLVRGVYPDRSPASDAFMVAALERTA